MTARRATTASHGHDWSIDSNERLYRWFDRVAIFMVLATALATFALTIRVGLILWWETMRWRFKKTLHR